MKVKNVALFSVLGMLVSGVSVYFLAPGPGSATAATVTPVTESVQDTPPQLADDNQLATFDAGSTVRVAGRVGHSRLVQGRSGETFVLLEVNGGEGIQARTSAPSHLAIVIDRSGSMKGERLPNAILGATAAVDHLGEGDMVSVIAFDTRTAVVVPATTIDRDSRERVKADIRRISLGTDTCISCGIEEGMAELRRSTDKVHRMIVLSDGDAADGVRDVQGFRNLAERARQDGMGVTTIGVGVAYNQKILGAIAQQSGGGHYFIENASSLEPVFQAEADKLRSTIASNAVASIDLGEGVELERVFDRSFERRGRKVIVPLGNFTQGENKTVLMKVRLPSNAEGQTVVANVDLSYKDLVKNEDGHCEGKLGVVMTSDPAGGSPLDPIVNARIQRSGTAAALIEANDLFQQGRAEEARQKLEEQEKALATASAEAATAAPAGRSAAIAQDYGGQSSAISGAKDGFSKTAPKPASDRAVRRNQELANPYMD